LASLVLLGLISFYGQGYKTPANDLTSLLFAHNLENVANVIGIFAGIIALLLMTHEYRYNTINYSLTAVNSRSKVLFAKFFAVLTYTFSLSVVATVLSFGLLMAGVAAAGNSLPHQDINYWLFLIKVLCFGEGMALAALIMASLIRNQVGSIVAFFLVPGTLEQLLGLLLKHNAVYLPFTALQQVIRQPIPIPKNGAAPEIPDNGYLTAPKGAAVFACYLVIAWIITWYLFLRRDAN
jgi:ABC-type transport system involved in multi-copper enzyme maturation permease subunit